MGVGNRLCIFAWAAITVVLLTGRCGGLASVSLATRGQRRYARVGYRRTGCSAGTFPLVFRIGRGHLAGAAHSQVAGSFHALRPSEVHRPDICGAVAGLGGLVEGPATTHSMPTEPTRTRSVRPRTPPAAGPLNPAANDGSRRNPGRTGCA